MGEVGVGWVAEPVRWDEIRPGMVVQGGGAGLAYVVLTGTATNEATAGPAWWIQVARVQVGDPVEPVTLDYLWAATPDETLPVLVRRDVLAGEVISAPG